MHLPRHHLHTSSLLSAVKQYSQDSCPLSASGLDYFVAASTDNRLSSNHHCSTAFTPQYFHTIERNASRLSRFSFDTFSLLHDVLSPYRRGAHGVLVESVSAIISLLSSSCSSNLIEKSNLSLTDQRIITHGSETCSRELSENSYAAAVPLNQSSDRLSFVFVRDLQRTQPVFYLHQNTWKSFRRDFYEHVVLT